MSEQPRRKDFIDPIVATPFAIWIIKIICSAIVYTSVSFFTKLGLQRLWEKEIDDDSDSS